MSKIQEIQEILVEPNKIEVGSIFKLKVRVIDNYINKQSVISENRKYIITENGKNIRTEWGG